MLTLARTIVLTALLALPGAALAEQAAPPAAPAPAAMPCPGDGKGGCCGGGACMEQQAKAGPDGKPAEGGCPCQRARAAAAAAKAAEAKQPAAP